MPNIVPNATLDELERELELILGILKERNQGKYDDWYYSFSLQMGILKDMLINEGK